MLKSITPEMREKMVKRVVQVLVTMAIQGLILFLAAGDFGWGWGWAYIGIYLVGILVNASILLRINPAVIAERADSGGAKGWDKVVSGFWGLIYFIALPVTAALDVRFGWGSGLSLGLHVLGLVIFSIGSFLFFWAMAVNAHFSTVVRVGAQDSHAVAMEGPYRIVRHPGYLGATLHSLATPLILGSWWAFVAAGFSVILMVIRTALEDKTLQAELAGYDQLVQQTRYRILPGIW